jgi:anhydro-N-acetylmuramic acid kinase
LKLQNVYKRGREIERDGIMQKETTCVVISPYRQTIHHLPTPKQLHGFNITSTLQIGEPSTIAQECGITTVGDFRPADMAVGGQGAPLVPYLDRILLERYFLKKERIGMLLNVGGISNLSVFIPPRLDANEKGRLIGFDCGPGTYFI